MKNERKKQLKTYILIGIILVLFLSWRLLFSEYATRSYDSLETMFKYYNGTDSEVVLTLEGRESAYVVGFDDSTQVSDIFSKKDDRWIDVSFPNVLTNYSLSNLCYSITLSKYNDEDCYISVMVRRHKDAIVYDSCGSEFISVPMHEESTGLYTVGLYAYVEDFDKDYWINVGGTQISIDQIQDF